MEKVNLCCDVCKLLKIAKQTAREKRHVVGVSCLKDESGAVKVSMDNRKKMWKEHMEKLINIENEWDTGIELANFK